ncbi:MAG TPA: FtsL-like putative cell division protein [Saprospiraceae bacterium]|nr:FtsL-like putative cell division protein [Saprospiraceae bacterium]
MVTDSNKKTTIFRSKWAEWIFVNLPFVCFLGLLGVLYIGIAHSSEKKLRKIEALQREVKDTRWYYMNLQQDLMYGGTQSEMEKKVQPMGLKSPRGNTKVINAMKQK